MAFADIYRGKRVLVTGHTGFKGAWLSEWLLALGADVTGLALPPPTTPALFAELGLESRLKHRIVDVRDQATVARVVTETQPDFVFHLAAQPIVRRSYSEPVETFATNVMGTAHVLDAVRLRNRPCVVIAVTTDKCYENREWVHSYREEDPLGGRDPYSASKGATEIVVSSYRRSFFARPDSPVRLASARAGNVVGGGDWAEDRIVPDCVKRLQAGEAIPVRNPRATRPWQHVLEPLSGYLWLAACLAQAESAATPLASAFNFGPSLASNRSVVELVQTVLKHWPGRWEDRSDPTAVHEAHLLNLATDKAHHLLGWSAAWDFSATIANTIAWYRAQAERRAAARQLTLDQIANYTAAARGAQLAWAN